MLEERRRLYAIGWIKFFPQKSAQSATKARLSDPVGADDHMKPVAKVVDGKGPVYAWKSLDGEAA
jgi:hypothetical protein